MGLFLRKKSSKASLKAAKDERRGATPPPQLPPLPDHIRRAEEAAAAAAAVSKGPSTPHGVKAARRRSRSLWAESDEAKAASPFSSAGDLASQPWRSHDAWVAFQNPIAPKAVLDELVFPCSPSASPGWRGRGGGGGGLFSTEGMHDEQTIRRAGTPTAPSSPMSVARFASPSSPLMPGRKLDFGSPLADTSKDKERAVTPPESLLMTPRARTGSYSVDRAPETGSSGQGASPDVELLTPNSLLLPSFNSRSPSPNPASGASFGSVAPPTPPSLGQGDRRWPRRALPPPPPESSEGHGTCERPESRAHLLSQTQVERPESRAHLLSQSQQQYAPQTPQAVEAQYQPEPQAIPAGAIDFSSPVMPAPSAFEPLDQPIMPRSSIPKRSSSSSSSRYLPARSSPSPIHFASPTMNSSPLPDGYMAPMRLPATPMSMSRPPSMGNTPSMLPYTQTSPVAPSRAVPVASRAAPRAYDSSSRYEQPGPAPRPPSRTSSGSQYRTHSRPASHGASSSSHGHSGYHSDAASVPVPHTPEGIAQAVSIWRQKSQRREVEAAIAAGVVNGPGLRPQQKEWENPDPFSPAGAWEAPGSYNPYDAAEFETQSFTAPLRLPKAGQPSAQAGHNVHPVTRRRPSAGHMVGAAQMRSPIIQQQVAQPGWI